MGVRIRNGRVTAPDLEWLELRSQQPHDIHRPFGLEDSRRQARSTSLTVEHFFQWGMSEGVFSISGLLFNAEATALQDKAATLTMVAKVGFTEGLSWPVSLEMD